MKKCTLVLLILFNIVACKKGEVNSSTIKNNADKETCALDSIDLAEYDKLDNIAKRAKWLRDSGKFVCDRVLTKAVLEGHEVKGALSIQQEKHTEKWGDLKKLIKNYRYEVYLDVVFTGNSITAVKLVDKYLPDDQSIRYRFSPVLIRKLGKKYAKDDNAEFQFSFAKLDQKNVAPIKSEQPVVVIQVVGNPGNGNPVEANPYYDYSTDPKYLSTDNIPF